VYRRLHRVDIQSQRFSAGLVADADEFVSRNGANFRRHISQRLPKRRAQINEQRPSVRCEPLMVGLEILLVKFVAFFGRDFSIEGQKR
jgi:hypothetical protein